MTTSCNERGFARYDLSPIPDRVTVTGATVHYFVYWDTLATQAEIRLLSVQPYPDSEPQAEEVYDSIGSGTLVATVDSTVLGWAAVELGAPAHRAIEERLTTTDWLGLGWSYPGTDSADAVARGWRSDSLKTYLTVEYELTGVEEPRRPEEPDWLGASIACGTLFLGQASSPKPQAATLLDISGQNLLLLRPGPNDVRHLSPGVYFVRATAGGRTTSQKVLLAR